MLRGTHVLALNFCHADFYHDASALRKNVPREWQCPSSSTTNFSCTPPCFPFASQTIRNLLTIFPPGSISAFSIRTGSKWEWDWLSSNNNNTGTAFHEGSRLSRKLIFLDMLYGGDNQSRALNSKTQIYFVPKNEGNFCGWFFWNRQDNYGPFKRRYFEKTHCANHSWVLENPFYGGSFLG